MLELESRKDIVYIIKIQPQYSCTNCVHMCVHVHKKP